MSEIDVRQTGVEKIDVIRFAGNDDHAEVVRASFLKKDVFGLRVRDKTSTFLFVTDKEHARNLILALEKAIQLDWLK